MTRAEIIEQGLKMQSDYEKNNKPKPGNVVGVPMWLPVEGGAIYCLHYPSRERVKGPVYIDIHGGGFLWAYPEEDDTLCTRINQLLDIEIYSIEYPKAPLNRFPSAIESLYRTVTYLCDHADQYNFDPDQVALGGHSAGGNLTAALLIKNKVERRFKVKCQVLDYPCVDMRCDSFTPDMFGEGDILSIELMNFFRQAYADPKDEFNVLCNPILATREDLMGLPPAVIMTCGNDVLKYQGRQFAANLRTADVPVIHMEYPGVTHAFDVFDGPHAQPGQDFLAAGIRYFMGL